MTLASGFAVPFAVVPSHSFSVRRPVCGSQSVPTCLHPPTLAGHLWSRVGDNGNHHLDRLAEPSKGHDIVSRGDVRSVSMGGGACCTRGIALF